MIAVRNSFMTTVIIVAVACLVTGALVAACARLPIYRQSMLINMTIVHMVEVSIMKVISMTVMFYCRMTAILAMNMIVIGMNFVIGHCAFSWDCL
jgi:hypothetical protein